MKRIKYWTYTFLEFLEIRGSQGSKRETIFIRIMNIKRQTELIKLLYSKKLSKIQLNINSDTVTSFVIEKLKRVFRKSEKGDRIDG